MTKYEAYQHLKNAFGYGTWSGDGGVTEGISGRHLGTRIPDFRGIVPYPLIRGLPILGHSLVVNETAVGAPAEPLVSSRLYPLPLPNPAANSIAPVSSKSRLILLHHLPETISPTTNQMKLIRFAALLLSAPVAAHAKTLTVDNKVGSVAMFTSVQAAHDAASSGDTILIAGSPTSYGNVTLTKRLDVVGPGYFLDENAIPGITKDSAVINALYLNLIQLSSPENSSVTGISFINAPSASAGVNDILFDKCFISSPGGSSDFLGRVSIKRSYVTAVFALKGPGSSIQNSVIINWMVLGNGTTASNCVIGYAPGMYSEAGSSISSSIFITPSTLSAASFAVKVKGSVTHSLAVGGVGIGGNPTFLPSGNGNIPNIAFIVQAFVSGHANDKAYVLAPGSPAIGSGLNGVDMGIFGGTLPYVISGVPSIPRITRFQVPATATSASGLHIEMDAQSF